MEELNVTVDSLNDHDVFILDAGETIYVYAGARSSPFLKSGALYTAKQLESQRMNAKVSHEVDKHFWALLSGQVPE